VYDYGCALGEYCLLREYEFFKETKFLVDDFHAATHTGCSSFTHTKAFRKDPKVSSLNSSRCESENKGMGSLRLTLSYMTEDMAEEVLSTYICIANRKKCLKYK
jgi:hypothetical protein